MMALQVYRSPLRYSAARMTAGRARARFRPVWRRSDWCTPPRRVRLDLAGSAFDPACPASAGRTSVC